MWFGSRVWGLCGLGSRVWGLLCGLGSRVWGLCGLGSRVYVVKALGFKVSHVRCTSGL